MDVDSIIESLDITPAELARRLGVSDGHVGDLKSGRRRLTLKVARKLELISGKTGIVDEVVRRETAS